MPFFLWNESLFIGFLIPFALRLAITYHSTWLVNSAAHMFGSKPYDKRINPAENILVSCQAVGEGFHNYHHTFPRDYAASEYGFHYFNVTKGFIDIMAFFGLGAIFSCFR
jgi:stearoyl-CoA desaturase (delta-9 desaturase)